MTREAWFCPSCQKHHAPHVETCPGGTGGIDQFVQSPTMNRQGLNNMYKPEPYPGWHNRVGAVAAREPCSGCKGFKHSPCGVANCPHKPFIGSLTNTASGLQ